MGALPTEMQANPEGCQRVAGGRSPLAPNDHRKTASQGRAPRRGARAGYNEPHSGPLSGVRRPVWHLCRGAGHLLRRFPEVATPKTPSGL